jgi:hypothetical protein
VVPFFQKTWFFWWILATLIILRWFHLFASSADDDGAFEAADSPKEASAGSKQILSGNAKSLLS